MTQMPQKLPNPIRETTPESIRLAKTLMRTAHFGSIAVLDPRDGRPAVSRVAIATDFDGTPVTLISRLSSHTKALLADPRCSLLLGEPGKGDPLAHPRISLACRARFLDRNNDESQAASARFLRRNPKSKLYADFADFSFVRLEASEANLNGGFGQAYRISGGELVSPGNNLPRRAEQKLIEDLNSRENPALNRTARAMGRKSIGRLVVTGCDPEGIDFVSGGRSVRYWFSTNPRTVDEILDELSG
jgi:heme iron utilization protein